MERGSQASALASFRPRRKKATKATKPPGSGQKQPRRSQDIHQRRGRARSARARAGAPSVVAHGVPAGSAAQLGVATTSSSPVSCPASISR